MTSMQDRMEELASEMIDLIASHGGEGWLGAIATGDTTWTVMVADSSVTSLELMESYVSSIEK